MKFEVISLFPDMIEGALRYGLVAQAVREKLISVEVTSPRQFTQDFHKTVDDRPYGGGDGMILLAEPLAQAVQFIQQKSEQRPYVVYLSAQGQKWTDSMAREWSQSFHHGEWQNRPLVLICGRYGGVDQRFINQFVDQEISVGDYVLTGGELPALTVIDTMARFVPGVLGNSASAQVESFAQSRLEGPSFTRPQNFSGQTVPAVLLTGDHKKIQAWRQDISDLLTYLRRPDLLAGEARESLNLQEKLKRVSREDLIACGLTEEELKTLSL